MQSKTTLPISLLNLIPYDDDDPNRNSSVLIPLVLETFRILNARFPHNLHKKDCRDARLASCLEYICRQQDLGCIQTEKLAASVGMNRKVFEVLHFKILRNLQHPAPLSHASNQHTELSIKLGHFLGDATSVSNKTHCILEAIKTFWKNDKHRQSFFLDDFRRKQLAYTAAAFYVAAMEDEEKFLQKAHVLKVTKLHQKELDVAISVVEKFWDMTSQEQKRGMKRVVRDAEVPDVYRGPVCRKTKMDANKTSIHWLSNSEDNLKLEPVQISDTFSTLSTSSGASVRSAESLVQTSKVESSDESTCSLHHEIIITPSVEQNFYNWKKKILKDAVDEIKEKYGCHISNSEALGLAADYRLKKCGL